MATLELGSPKSVVGRRRMLAAMEEARELRSQGSAAQSAETYREALRLWLRRKWVDHCGRPMSTIQDAETLCYRLRCALVLDRPAFDAISGLLQGSTRVTSQQLDELAAAVESLVAEAKGVAA